MTTLTTGPRRTVARRSRGDGALTVWPAAPTMRGIPVIHRCAEDSLLNDQPLRTVGPAAEFDIVAIGASAGGVEALHVVVNALPADFPVPVVIVQHLDPRYRSRLAELLSRHSRLPVKQADDGEPL